MAMRISHFLKNVKFPQNNTYWRFPVVLVNSKAIHTGNEHVQMAQRKVSVSGLEINCEQVGQGEHPVLCLPGALGFIESDFGPILPKFSPQKYTVICWDPPGYGKSRPPNRDFSGGAQFFHRDAECAKGLMQSLGYSKFSMLGWSDGANTACVLAAKFPESVRKLVIWGGNAYITEADIKLYNQVKDIDKWSDRMKAPMIKMYGEDYFRKYWAMWTDAFTDIYQNGGGDIYTKLVPQIQCPTFIIHGMKDAMVPLEHFEYFKKHIKNSRSYVFPDGKHNLHLKYADEFVKMVEQFLDEK